MISFVRGRLAFVTENSVEIDVGGVGYEVFVPTSVLSELPPKGNEVELYTYLNVKEDEMSLFGFLTRDALSVFKHLISVSGVGPKGALGLLSAVSPDDLRFAVLSSDVKLLSKAPGIGKKTAERLVIELRDKFGKDAEIRAIDREVQNTAAFSDSDPRQDTVLALIELGFPGAEAYKAVRELDPEIKDVELLLKQALKKLGR